MPISMTFFAGQGDEPTLIKVGTAYEAATHHRFAPPAFGPLPDEAKKNTFTAEQIVGRPLQPPSHFPMYTAEFSNGCVE
jgi:hypothetical protein